MKGLFQMVKSFVFFSEAHTPQAVLARFKRHIIPILTALLGKDAPKEITISENHICINDTPVGDCRFMSNFKSECGGLKFDYNDKFRIVSFDFFHDYKVSMITEHNKNEKGYKIIYERGNVLQ